MNFIPLILWAAGTAAKMYSDKTKSDKAEEYQDYTEREKKKEVKQRDADERKAALRSVLKPDAVLRPRSTPILKDAPDTTTEDIIGGIGSGVSNLGAMGMRSGSSEKTPSGKSNPYSTYLQQLIRGVEPDEPSYS